jgi:acetylornithine deacetylase
VETSLAEPLVSAVVRACSGRPPSGSQTMSDMVLLRSLPAIKIGPGDTRRSHVPDEFLCVTELEEGAAAYERIINEYFAAMRATDKPAASTGATA